MAGIFVVVADFMTPHLDSFTFHHIKRSGAACRMIFLNKQAPADPRRFTLTHELGHAVMRTTDSSDMEDEANRFAAEFLMPEAGIKPSTFVGSLA